VPGTIGGHDLCIRLGDAPGQVVDVAGGHAQLVLDALLQVDQVAGRRAETRRHLVGTRQHHGTRGQVGGCVRHVGEGVEHVGNRGTQAAGAAGEQVLELLELFQPLGIGGCDGLGQRGLAGQELVVCPNHRGSVDAIAVITGARERAVHALQHDGLFRVARRVDVGDVVARGLQRELVGHQGPGADVQDGHVRSCIMPGRAAAAASC
jgi:hypothetical protein